MGSQSNPYKSPAIPSAPNVRDKTVFAMRPPWYLRLSTIVGWIFTFLFTAAYVSPPVMISNSGGRAQKLTGLLDHSLLLPIGLLFISAIVAQVLIYDYRRFK